MNCNCYTGEFKNNLRHGKGKEETLEHFYQGEFRKDKKEGIGKLSYKGTKDSYEGEFKDNCITGTGVYKWTNGDSYEGTFVNGKMHGRGIYHWPDGGEYEGDYVDNMKEGFGTFKWVNGKIYKGGFMKNQPHGNGLMNISNETFEVTFDNGKTIRSVKVDFIKSCRVSSNNLQKSNTNMVKVASPKNNHLSVTRTKK